MPFDGNTRWQIDILAADKSGQAFAAVNRRIDQTNASIAGLGRTMASGIGQSVALGRGLQQLAIGYGVVSAAQHAFQAGLRIGDLGEQAEQLGVTTDQLQAYRLMAAQAGVGVEQLDAAILKLQRAMGAANDGSDEMIARFEKLGVKILDASGNLRKPADVLPELSRGLLAVGSDTERTALMAELLGKSGARLKTMLEGWAAGNDRLVASAKAQNAIAGPDAIKAWDELGDALKVAEQRYDTMVGTLGKPVALVGMQAINFQLGNINSLINNITKGWNWLTSGPSISDLQTALGEAQGRVADLQRLPEGPGKAAMLQQELETVTELQGKIASLGKAAVTLPPVVVTADAPGVSNPVGKQASAAGAKLDERLKDLQAERAALEKALAAFDVRGLETVSEVDRRLDAQVKLDQKIASVLKDVPPNSPLAGALIQEATAVAQLNTRLDERKRLMTEAEQVMDRFGNGSRAAARETERLNQMLAAGAIDADTYARALKATKDAAGEQERAARGAAGGFDGFMAGVEQYGAEMQKANSAFETGKFVAQEFGSVFSGVNQGLREGKDLWTSLGDAGVSALGRISDKLIEMAVQDLIGAALGGSKGGAGGGGGMIMNLFGGGSMGGTSSGLFDSIMGLFNFFPMLATGGIPPVGSPYIVGENGPEVRIDGRPGQIFNRDQWSRMGGGGQSVIVHVYANEGFVRAEAEGAAVRVVNQATPGIVKESVKQSGSRVVPIYNRHEAERGGDYRVG